MTKRNQILIIILGVQLILALYLFWPQSHSAKTSLKTLFPDISAEDVVELALKDAEGNSVQIQKKEGGWILPAYGGYPADQGKVSSFLKKLTALETKPLVARKKSSHRRLKVSEDDFQRVITFKAGNKEKTQSLYLGSSPGYKKTHIRAGSGSEVYLAGDISVWEAGIEPSSWTDTLYFSVEEKDVVNVSVKNAHGTINLERGDQNEWVLRKIKSGLKLKVEEWNSMLRKAVAIRMEEPLGREKSPSFGLKKPSAVLTVVTEVASNRDKDNARTKEKQREDESEKVHKTYTIRIGAQDKEKKGYIVKSSESPFFVRVPVYAVEPFIEKKVDDLTEKKEEIGN